MIKKRNFIVCVYCINHTGAGGNRTGGGGSCIFVPDGMDTLHGVHCAYTVRGS